MVKEIFPSTLDNLVRIAEFVTRAARQAGFNEDQIYEVELAVDEACTNIIEHGYSNQPGGVITCICQELPTGLQIVIEDHGTPFDPSSIPAPDLSLPLESVQAGGAGVYLMYQMMDDVRYESIGGSRNKLTLLKRRKS
jgi:anti-sigma regulatory factor (Ser/Thr protein kinase)